MKISINAAVREFDVENHRLILDLAFMNDDQLNDLFRLAEEQGLLKFSVALSKRSEEIEDIQRNIWFMYATWVLRKNGAPINHESLSSLSNDWKAVYLPTSTIVVNGKELPVPTVSLKRGKNEIPKETMMQVLASIKRDYLIPDDLGK